MTPMTNECLAELSDRVAKGDVRALEIVFESFSGMALAVAVRILKDRSESEEVVQESFLQMWKTATRYEPQRASLSSWIISIVKSRAIDRLRSNDSRLRVADSIERENSEVATDLAPDLLLDVQRSTRRVQALLAELPRDERDLLELSYYQGLSHQEISQQTSLPLGTVKTRVRRATLKLAEVLKAETITSAERMKKPLDTRC